MRALFLSLTAVTVLSLATATTCFAQRTAGVWVGEGRTFRAENGGWSEYYQGQKAFTFANSGSGPGWVGLYDAARGIRVELSATQAVVSRGGQTLFAYRGMWHWKMFTRSDGKGSFVGVNGKWSETFNGQTIFTFVETGRSRDQVILFDASRGIEVKLTSREAIVTAGSRQLMTYPGSLYY